jgi:hypothetical protein
VIRLLLALTLVLSSLGGCGYARPGSGDNLGEIRMLMVELFANATYEPFLENELTNAVTQRFLRTSRWQLVEDRSTADAVFSGTVVDYTSLPISFDSNDNVLEYRAQIKVAAVLRHNQDGRVLWKGELLWSEEYPGSLDKGLQEDQEAAAIRICAERLAEELFFRLTDNF